MSAENKYGVPDYARISPDYLGIKDNENNPSISRFMKEASKLAPTINSIQVAVCKCGSVVSACTQPECYMDEDWKAELENQKTKGRTIEWREPGSWVLESCKCIKVTCSKNAVCAFNNDGVCTRTWNCEWMKE